MINFYFKVLHSRNIFVMALPFKCMSRYFEMKCVIREYHVSVCNAQKIRNPIPFRNNFNFQSRSERKVEVVETDTQKRNTPNITIVSEDLMSVSRENSEKKFYRKPLQKSRWSCYGEWLFGLHPVYLALKAQKRKFYQLFIKEDNSSQSSSFEKSELRNEIRSLANLLEIKTTCVTNRSLSSLLDSEVHQGVCLDASPYPMCEYHSEFELRDSKCDNSTLWLVLSEIQDPMNVGAVLRSAYYFGVNKVFLTANNSCRLSPIVSKASSGALETLDMAHIYDLEAFLQERKEQGWSIVSSRAYLKSGSGSGGQNLIDFILTKPTILILGNESRGISPAVQSICDHFISIPPRYSDSLKVDSLNVSVATGIILHHLLHGKEPETT